ncbi:MAG: hypothetical protein H6575_12220 [Lewinellaceae bacterium]|nr:hypothetical protein [Lewinellaceae bacterium]
MPWRLPKYDIKLFLLGNPNTLEAVTQIENKGNTILLLDAFDEDIKAMHNYEQRMNEILKIVWVPGSGDHLPHAVFPTQKEEPHETGYFTGGTAVSINFRNCTSLSLTTRMSGNTCANDSLC